jgi:signal recognition particle subunit SRP54
MDGDARGGASLSVTRVVGVPVKFMGMGEKTDALEPFHPDRLASRILGMGDVVTLVERAEQAIDEKHAREMERKLRKAEFDLNDFLEQIQALKKMGSFAQLMDMIPGGSALSKRMPQNNFDEKQMKRVEAIIRSMTSRERAKPEIIDGSRRRRIAVGSGTQTQDVSRLINQFREAQKLMKKLAAGRGPGVLRGLFR